MHFRFTTIFILLLLTAQTFTTMSMDDLQIQATDTTPLLSAIPKDFKITEQAFIALLPVDVWSLIMDNFPGNDRVLNSFLASSIVPSEKIMFRIYNAFMDYLEKVPHEKQHSALMNFYKTVKYDKDKNILRLKIIPILHLYNFMDKNGAYEGNRTTEDTDLLVQNAFSSLNRKQVRALIESCLKYYDSNARTDTTKKYSRSTRVTTALYCLVIITDGCTLAWMIKALDKSHGALTIGSTFPLAIFCALTFVIAIPWLISLRACCDSGHCDPYGPIKSIKHEFKLLLHKYDKNYHPALNKLGRSLLTYKQRLEYSGETLV